jgi:hypothetical protein
MLAMMLADGLDLADLDPNLMALAACGVIGLVLILVLIVRARRRARRKQRPVVDVVERRKSARYAIVPVSVLISNTQSRSAAVGAMVIDRSRGGVRLQTAKGFSVGTILTVWSGDGNDPAPWFKLEVRNCLHVGAIWQVGCQFFAKPSAAQLRLLGG